MTVSGATPSTTAQPEAGLEMSVSMSRDNVTARPPQGVDGDDSGGPPRQGLVSRLRGGGAAKSCFLDAIACFLCFECCEGCCDCIADIVCCPCEVVCDMCC